MMDDATLDRGLRESPPADPRYRSRIGVVPPAGWRAAAWGGAPVLARRGTPAATWLLATVTVVTLGVGAILFAVGQGPSRVPAPSPVPTDLPSLLPTVIPPGVETGVVDTPLGSARWVRIEGDLTSLPGPSAHIVPGRPGLVALDPASSSFWDSTDGITWIARPLPVDVEDAQDLTLVADTYWLEADGDRGARTTR